MRLSVITGAALLSLVSATSYAQERPPRPGSTQPQIDLQAIGMDEQALISAVRHTDQNIASLMREVSTLREELAKAQVSPTGAPPSVMPPKSP
jgi:hypothetical protein